MAPISQLSAFFPPAPTFTETSLPSLAGKVYIVTGAASGVGYELAKILFLAGGKVYIAARSKARCEGAIQKIKAETNGVSKEGKSQGALESMIIDLADLRTVKPAVEEFTKRETRLDLIMHNAAVMTPPAGSKDALGHDLEIGTNCLAPYLMTLLLEPILIRTASAPDTKAGSVRIVFVTSLLQAGAPIMSFQADGTPKILTKFMENYMQSKVGDAWLAVKFAERLGKHGILSVSLHPGLMQTELQRHWILPARILMRVLFKPPKFGAYSELYAAFSPEVKSEDNGGHLMAWGRKSELPEGIKKGLKKKAEGGSGQAEEFFEYCDRETREFL